MCFTLVLIVFVFYGVRILCLLSTKKPCSGCSRKTNRPGKKGKCDNGYLLSSQTIECICNGWNVGFSKVNDGRRTHNPFVNLNKNHVVEQRIEPMALNPSVYLTIWVPHSDALKGSSVLISEGVRGGRRGSSDPINAENGRTPDGLGRPPVRKRIRSCLESIGVTGRKDQQAPK